MTTNPDTIPADIREAAANALNIAEDMPGTLFSDRVDAIAKAILTERERCAEVAKEAALYSGCPIEAIADEIADAVRGVVREDYDVPGNDGNSSDDDLPF